MGQLLCCLLNPPRCPHAVTIVKQRAVKHAFMNDLSRREVD